jgi:II/X family phage/plasmid replication protein
MLDTVKLESPELGEDLAREIEARCVRRSAVEIGTGELLYELTTGSLEGSYDHRVSIRVMRSRLVQHKRQSFDRESGRTVSTSSQVYELCKPYVLLEGSVHKAMLGHNVYGGPESVREACEWLVQDVGSRLAVELPNGSEWLVRRIDWAEVYELPDYSAVEEYVWGLNSAEYPRRSVARYGRESIFAAGRTTAVKAYHKGPEFSKHDHKRLRGIMQDADLHDLQHYANRVLRWEVSVKAKKLDEDHGQKPRVSEISADYLRKLHYREVRRLVREGEAEVKTVRKQKDVRDRLLEVYDSRKAGLLLGTWHQLVTLGEKETARAIAPSTFRRHKQLLRDAGVSWIGADVLVVPRVSTLPADFSPTQRDPRRRAGEDPVVVAKLRELRAA